MGDTNLSTTRSLSLAKTIKDLNKEILIGKISKKGNKTRNVIKDKFIVINGKEIF